MRLEIQEYQIDRIQFGPASQLHNGALQVNRQELQDLLARDQRFASVELAVVNRGERARITNILDILEPRCLARGEPTYYPGLYGDLYRAGDGTTIALKGCSVLEMGMMPGFFGAVLDMFGEGAQFGLYAQNCSLCLLTEPSPGLSQLDYGLALKQAGIRASVYLAALARKKQPSQKEVFDLGEAKPPPSDLPRLAYLYQLHSHGDSREPFIYGDNCRRYYPTILHPNEILDGAIACGHYNISFALKIPSYAIVNHPVVLDLYRRHRQQEIDFRGVVIAPEPTSLLEIRRTSQMAAGLFKNVLDAQGVVISKEGGGHTDVDLMSNCDACEELGIKTVLIDNEWLGPQGDGQAPLLAMSAKADAMVSVGNSDGVINLTAADRVIGGEVMLDAGEGLAEAVTVPLRCLANGLSQAGLTYLTTKER